jgi:hypothetical protein
MRWTKLVNLVIIVVGEKRKIEDSVGAKEKFFPPCPVRGNKIF